MHFGEALQLLHAGHTVTRTGWNDPGQFINLQTPNPMSEMTLPYLYISTVTGHLVPWLASQSDMLADDWTEHSGYPALNE
ncbi:MAG: DUF2829 domain-containing protein [Candidatus Dormibacteraceae bacterium]